MRLLKEFDLMIPGDKVRKRTFALQVRCVTALYERLFPRFKTQDCWKILINCVSDSPKPKYRNLLGVYELDIVADVEAFFSLKDDEKKVWAYEYLQLGIFDLLKQTGWVAEPFIETFKKAKNLNLRNVWLWKAVSSPSKKLVAEVWVDHDVRFCTISLLVRDSSGREIKNQRLITELPSEWAYADHLGSLSWESEKRVILKNKDMDREWQIEL